MLVCLSLAYIVSYAHHYSIPTTSEVRYALSLSLSLCEVPTRAHRAAITAARTSGLLLGAALVTTSAIAGPIDACYDDAEALYPARSMTVFVGQTSVLTSADLHDVFDKVAELHSEPTLMLAFNSAGRDALRHAMTCVFDAEAATLSAVYLNQSIQSLNVRPQTGRVQDSSGQVVAALRFERVLEPSCTVYKSLELVDDGTTSTPWSLYIGVQGFGANDLIFYDVPQSLNCNEKGPEFCSGECLGECVEQPDPLPPVMACSCSDPAGRCEHEDIPTIGNPVAVFAREV